MLSKETQQSKKHKIELSVNDAVYQRLQQMTHAKFNEISNKKISQLIRQIIGQHIVEFLDPLKVHYDPTGKFRSKRYEMKIRLSTEEYAVLTQLGVKDNTTAQGALFGVVRNAIAKEKDSSKDYLALIGNLPTDDKYSGKKKRVKKYIVLPKFLTE